MFCHENRILSVIFSLILRISRENIPLKTMDTFSLSRHHGPSESVRSINQGCRYPMISIVSALNCFELLQNLASTGSENAKKWKQEISVYMDGK